jgi:hypothetical protein
MDAVPVINTLVNEAISQMVSNVIGGLPLENGGGIPNVNDPTACEYIVP